MRTTLTAPLPGSAPTQGRPRLRRVHHEPEAGGTDPALWQAPPVQRPPVQRPPFQPPPFQPPRFQPTMAPPHPAPPRQSEPISHLATAEQLAEAHQAVARVFRLAFEVLDGRRQAAHLARHVDAGVLRYWQVVVRQRRLRRPARLRQMRLCLPQPAAAEVAVVCDIDGRVRAIAARFERAVGGPAAWRCTALRLL